MKKLFCYWRNTVFLRTNLCLVSDQQKPASSIKLNRFWFLGWQITAEEISLFIVTFWCRLTFRSRGKEQSYELLLNMQVGHMTELVFINRSGFTWEEKWIHLIQAHQIIFYPNTIKAWSHWKRRPFFLNYWANLQSHYRLELIFFFIYIHISTRTCTKLNLFAPILLFFWKGL